ALAVLSALGVTCWWATRPIREVATADQVRLDWGRLPPLPPDSVAVEIRLGTEARDGWFVAVIDPEPGAPVAVRVRAGVRALLPVAARAIPAGMLLADSDIEWQERTAWGSAGRDVIAASPAGGELRRSVVAGELLDDHAVQPAAAVSAGEQVTMVWSRGTVRLERIAMALTTARIGEPVRARAGDTRLLGRAIAPGIAMIEGGVQ
ncbi:MAG TPA: flagellar basal body P-ring formation chaperone FlgA, partial [Gemmatimonadales bacterium]|nr:flagellar basal body P-ring formation chaperone FlgA [Gemmatimonadales bacterium]